MNRLLIVLLGMSLAVAAGCGPASGEHGKKSRARAAVDDVVDTVVIQRGKLEAGVRAGKKIRAISAEEKKDLDEVMGQ